MASTDYSNTLGTIDSTIGALTGTSSDEAKAVAATAKAQKAAEEEATKRAMYTYGTIAVGLVTAAFLGVIYFSRR